MSDFVKLVKLVIMGLILVPLVWLGSCVMLGVGAAVAVKQVADSDLTEETIKQHKLHQVRAKNEEINRESTYPNRYDDYGEPM